LNYLVLALSALGVSAANLAVSLWILGRVRAQQGEVQRDIRRLEEALSREAGQVRMDMRSLREELLKYQQDQRVELRNLVETSSIRQMDALSRGMESLGQGQASQLERILKGLEASSSRVFQGLGTMNESVLSGLSRVQEVLAEGMERIRRGNEEKLDRMRDVVEEKLQGALERRLGEAFSSVSERLEKVHQGLGEMRALASDVGDLKRVLSNVKSRGIWGEIQLGNMLEQVMSPDQYGVNVQVVPGSSNRVEFAVKLPGDESPVWLPLDSKFPQEDYQRLLSAQEASDPKGAEEARRELANRIVAEARSIRDKYVCPPHTTDFAVMYLPVEGLYAEVLKAPGLAERLMTEFRVVPSGPTVLAALLNSLQMGFRTLAIQRRSGEVWKLLGQVKGDLRRFGEMLEKARRKIQDAGDELDRAASRSRTMERRLRDVEELPEEAGQGVE
jgi:DNA recombination protein RmuC